MGQGGDPTEKLPKPGQVGMRDGGHRWTHLGERVGDTGTRETPPRKSRIPWVSGWEGQEMGQGGDLTEKLPKPGQVGMRGGGHRWMHVLVEATAPSLTMTHRVYAVTADWICVGG